MILTEMETCPAKPVPFFIDVFTPKGTSVERDNNGNRSFSHSTPSVQEMKKNTWLAKFSRTLSAFLPIASSRKGACRRCGACCSLPRKCWFFKQDEHGMPYCSIYLIRPLQCRKYPRTERECLTKESCGYTFSTQ